MRDLIVIWYDYTYDTNFLGHIVVVVAVGQGSHARMLFAHRSSRCYLCTNARVRNLLPESAAMLTLQHQLWVPVSYSVSSSVEQISLLIRALRNVRMSFCCLWNGDGFVTIFPFSYISFPFSYSFCLKDTIKINHSAQIEAKLTRLLRFSLLLSAIISLLVEWRLEYLTINVTRAARLVGQMCHISCYWILIHIYFARNSNLLHRGGPDNTKV